MQGDSYERIFHIMAIMITYINLYNVLFLCVLLVNGVAAPSVGGPVGMFCTPGTEDCYVLYKTESSNGVTWNEAYTACQGFNKQLAVVRDENTQKTVDQFVFPQNQQQDITGHAWIAGVRSTDMNWRDTQGNIIKTRVGNSGDTSRLCSRLMKDNNELDLVAASCKGSGVQGICERQVFQGYSCGEEEAKDSSTNTCIFETEQAYESWSQAYAACYNKGARLSFKEFNSTELQRSKYSFLTDNYYWAALTRRPWVWRTPETKEYELLKYSNFRPGEGMTVGEDCVHMELRDGGKWSDKNCDFTSDYFICQTLPLQPTTDTTPVATPVVTEVVTDTTEGDRQTTISSNRLPANLLTNRDFFILVASIGAALIIMNMTVAVICLRRNKKDEKKATTEEKHQVNPYPLTEVIKIPELLGHISAYLVENHYDDIQHYSASQAPTYMSDNYHKIPSRAGSKILPNHNAPIQGLTAVPNLLPNHNAPTQDLNADHDVSGIDQNVNHNATSGIDQEDSDSGIVNRFDPEGYLAPVGGTGSNHGSSRGGSSDQGSQINVGEYLTTSRQNSDKEGTSTDHDYLILVNDDGNDEIREGSSEKHEVRSTGNEYLMLINDEGIDESPEGSAEKPEGSDEKPDKDVSYASLDAQTRPPNYAHLKDVAENMN